MNKVLVIILALSGATAMCSSIVVANSLSIELISVDDRYQPYDTLPKQLSHLDPQRNRLIPVIGDYYGVKTLNEKEELGFKLYDKNFNLLWELKTLECPVWEVEVSENAETVLFKSKHAENDGILIYTRESAQYKKTGEIKLHAEKLLTAIDEINNRIYAVGVFFPVTSEEHKGQNIICFSKKGDVIWRKPLPDLNASEKALNISKISEVIQVSYATRNPFGYGMALFTKNGEQLGSDYRVGPTGHVALLGKDKAMLISEENLRLYQTNPFSKIREINLGDDSWVKSKVLDVDVSKDESKIAVLQISFLKDETMQTRQYRIVILDGTGEQLSARQIESPTHPSVERINFVNNNELLVNSTEKTWRYSLEK